MSLLLVFVITFISLNLLSKLSNRSFPKEAEIETDTLMDFINVRSNRKDNGEHRYISIDYSVHMSNFILKFFASKIYWCWK